SNLSHRLLPVSSARTITALRRCGRRRSVSSPFPPRIWRKISWMSVIARVVAPLIAECFANLECRVIDSRLVNRYNLFVLEVLKAWVDPAQESPKTIHHHGYGKFVIDGKIIKLKSKM